MGFSTIIRRCKLKVRLCTICNEHEMCEFRFKEKDRKYRNICNDCIKDNKLNTILRCKVCDKPFRIRIDDYKKERFIGREIFYLCRGCIELGDYEKVDPPHEIDFCCNYFESDDDQYF
jgi:hypothetical protein